MQHGSYRGGNTAPPSALSARQAGMVPSRCVGPRLALYLNPQTKYLPTVSRETSPLSFLPSIVASVSQYERPIIIHLSIYLSIYLSIFYLQGTYLPKRIKSYNGSGTVARTRHTEWLPTDNHTRTEVCCILFEVILRPHGSPPA